MQRKRYWKPTEFREEILGCRSFSVERNSCYNSPQYTFIPPVSYERAWTDGNRETKFERDGISNRDEWIQKGDREDKTNGTPLQLILL